MAPRSDHASQHRGACVESACAAAWHSSLKPLSVPAGDPYRVYTDDEDVSDLDLNTPEGSEDGEGSPRTDAPGPSAASAAASPPQPTPQDAAPASHATPGDTPPKPYAPPPPLLKPETKAKFRRKRHGADPAGKAATPAAPPAPLARTALPPAAEAAAPAGDSVAGVLSLPEHSGGEGPCAGDPPVVPANAAPRAGGAPAAVSPKRSPAVDLVGHVAPAGAPAQPDDSAHAGIVPGMSALCSNPAHEQQTEAEITPAAVPDPGAPANQKRRRRRAGTDPAFE